MKVKDLQAGDTLLVVSKFEAPAKVSIERVKKVYQPNDKMNWFADSDAISLIDGRKVEAYISDHHFELDLLRVERIPAPVFDKAMHLRDMYLAGLKGLVSGSELLKDSAAKLGCDNDNDV